MPDASFFLDAVNAHASTAVERCRDRWGPATGMLADGFDLSSHEPLRWEGAIVSDLSCQQNLLRVLDGLARMTGAELWEQVAEEWIGQALHGLVDADSGLLYWGGHTAWSLETDTILKGNHELKCAFPFYAYLHQADANTTQAFIDAFWHAHIWDWSTLLFNRHGEYEPWDRDAAWSGTFGGTGGLPIVENTALSFINTGSDLIYAATQALRLSGRREPYEWAMRLLECYEAIRHPETGLAGYQFNHREPCRVRESFLGALGERDDVNETTVVTNGVIGTRYGRVAVCLLNEAEALGDDGAPLRELVRNDLLALSAHCWREDEGHFQCAVNDGTPLTPEHTQDVGYCPPSKLKPVRASGAMLLSYARAWRLLRDDALRTQALAIARAMGWGDLEAGPVSLPDAASADDDPHAHGGQADACALEALLDLYEADGADHLLDAATRLGEQMVSTHVTDGLFTARSGLTMRGDQLDGRQITSIDSAAPVALLRLAHVLAGSDDPAPPMLYPNNTMFDPKVVVARRD